MYKVKFGGKDGNEIRLVESKDKLVVRTKGNKAVQEVKLSDESRELLDNTTEIASFPEAGVTIHKVDSDQGLQDAEDRRDETRASLKQEDTIRFAGRVLEDSESGEAMLYTENFFVKFQDELATEECIEFLKKYHLQVKSLLAFAPNSFFVEAEEGTGLNIFEIADQLLQEKSVMYCHPEMVQERQYKNRHPMQWHLGPTVINGKAIEQHVNIDEAWAVTKGAGAVVAVIDDGFDIEHPEFYGRIVHPVDVTLNTDNPRPQTPRDNHGTACAGMACAAGLEGGASGTAPEALFMPIRLRSGLGSIAEANAFVWAADHGADVISCSWGPSDGDWWNPDDPMHKRMAPIPDSTRLAMEYALTKGRQGKGCVILFSAGNGNENIETDGYASYPGVIAVTACNDTGRRSVYSDYGEAVFVSFPSGDFGSQTFMHPAPISPGLRTTDRLDEAGYDEGDYVNTFLGTSAACPGMAGVVALMIAANPNLQGAQVKDLVRQSCQLIDLAGGEYKENGHSKWYGYGRIDAGLAVNQARAMGPQLEPVIEGTALFRSKKMKFLENGAWIESQKGRRMLGFQLKPSEGSGLEFEVQVYVSGLRLSHSGSDHKFAGTEDGRRKITGFSIRMSGPKAGMYKLQYEARFSDNTNSPLTSDGAWCGSQSRSGQAIESIRIVIETL
ncbi:MAG: S8 family serine peptidase [Saprospiraceae bacterium]